MRFWNRPRISGVGTAIVCTLLACTGCGQPPATGKIEITYWEKWTGFEDDAMQAVVDDFNNSQNRIFVRKLAGIGEVERKLMLATAGGDPPDVAGIWPTTVTAFSEKGALTPLDKMIQEAGIKSEDYVPVFWDMCSYHGFMWALPSTPTSLALHWNKKLFREAGLDPDRPPRSLDELEAMSERLTIVEIKRGDKLVRVHYPDLTDAEKRAKNFKLVQIGHDPQQPGWWMPLWVYWFGGKLWDGQRHITADSPEMIETLRWLRAQPEKYGVDNRRAFGAAFAIGSNASFQSPQNPFFSDRIAMTLQGVWMYNFISKYAPQMEWGAAPFPAKDPARFPLVTIVDEDVLAIPKGARHPREAFEFIRYVNQQGPMEKLCLGQRKFSPLANVSDEFYRQHPNPHIKEFVEAAKSPDARSEPRFAIWGVYNDELNAAIDRIMALEATPEEAVGPVQARVQWKLDRMLTRWEMVKDWRMKEWSEYDAR
jgi:ABC-type glycerol-3-phosphate transport system substrate-binding protein